MKTFFFAVLMLLANLSFGQAIDSVAVDTSVNPHKFFVRLRFPSTDYTVTRVRAGIGNYLIYPPYYEAHFFTKECGPQSNYLGFDSTFYFTLTPPYNLIAVVFLDSNTTDTNCAYRTQPQITDYQPILVTSTLSVGSLAEAETGLSLYPNPASTVFRILSPQSTRIQSVLVLDLYGRAVIKEHGTAQISVAGLPAGLYHVVIQTNKGGINRKLTVVR